MDQGEYDGEITMLDEAFTAAVAGCRYNAEGAPIAVYHGPVLVELHVAFGFTEEEAYNEIDSWRLDGDIDVLWPVNVVTRPAKPDLKLVH